MLKYSISKRSKILFLLCKVKTELSFDEIILFLKDPGLKEGSDSGD